MTFASQIGFINQVEDSVVAEDTAEYSDSSSDSEIDI